MVAAAAGGGGGVSPLVLKLGRLKPLQPASIRPPANALITGTGDWGLLTHHEHLLCITAPETAPDGF